MQFYFVTPVWGVNHLGLFVNIGLPSLLAPGNLPALAATDSCRFLIYTRVEDEPRLRSASVFEHLASVLPVEVCIIPEPLGNAHIVMSNCHADALKRADADDAAAVFVPPDCVWADGSMVHVGRIAHAGKSMIHMSGIRLDRDAVVPQLRQHLAADGHVLDISAQQLVTLGLAHLHPIAFTHFWNEHPGGLMPANLYWTVSGEGLALRCFHLHPLLIKSQIKFANFTSTIDDDLALHACPDASRDHVVTDSDTILAFELSGLERVVGADFQKGSVEAVASWAEVGTNSRHHLLAGYPIRVHFGHTTEGLWQQVEAEGARVIGDILRINQMRSSTLAWRHPAVLVWRYYAMTLNKGRYFGKSQPVSRVLVPMLRWFVHAMRRFRRLLVDRAGRPLPWHPRRLLMRHITWHPASESAKPQLVDPLAAAAAQRRGDAKRARGNWLGAIREYDEAISISPPNAALYYLRGTAHQKVGEFTAAIADFESGLKLDPGNPTLQFLLQQVQAERQLAETPATIDAALATELQLRGDAQRAQGNHAAAILDYSAAIRVSAPNTALYYLRGTARLELGEAADALADFRRGLELEPGNRELQRLATTARARTLASRMKAVVAGAINRFRLLHPLWLVRRTTVTAVLGALTPDDQTLGLVSDDAGVVQPLTQARPRLLVAAARDVAPLAQAGGGIRHNLIAVVDLDCSPNLAATFTAASSCANRVVCLRLDRPPLALAGDVAVQFRTVGGLGTRAAYALYRMLRRLRRDRARLPPALHLILFALLPLLALPGALVVVLTNVAGLGLDWITTARRDAPNTTPD